MNSIVCEFTGYIKKNSHLETHLSLSPAKFPSWLIDFLGSSASSDLGASHPKYLCFFFWKAQLLNLMVPGPFEERKEEDWRSPLGIA